MFTNQEGQIIQITILMSHGMQVNLSLKIKRWSFTFPNNENTHVIVMDLVNLEAITMSKNLI